jgi:glycosyltransferase involved in cell wall biosynthesis
VPVKLEEISVIVPTRNEAHNIPHLLASLHPSVELIVVDASSDGTPAIVERLRPERTRIIRSEAKIAPARQIGAQAARGRWLIFSDADVRFEPGYFERLAMMGEAAAFYGPKYATGAHPYYSQFFNAGQRAIHRLGIPAASGSNMGLRREVFASIGGFRLDLPVNEDTEIMMRARRHGYDVAYVRALAVRSFDDRRLRLGVIRKLAHTVVRNLLLLINLYIPLPQRWLRHDWGYWSKRHAHRSDLRDVPAQR